MGIRGRVSRNTLANANSVRDWRIYRDFGQVLIRIARPLYADADFGVEIKHAAYALDSTIIDLCLSLFPWARFRRAKGAIKIHTLLDLRGNIPTIIIVTCGKIHDVNILDVLVFEAGAFYVMDRGYLDFARLYKIHLTSAFFVTRAKKNFRFKRRYSRPVDKLTGIQCDQIVTLTGFYPSKDYPEKLRRIRYFDHATNKHFVFLTNNFTLPPLVIAGLYRSRWQVELFFKWIKQHLRIKAFYGTSENAVKTQVWIAVCSYLLVAIVRKRLKLDASLYTILQIASVSLFDKTPMIEAFSIKNASREQDESHNQLRLLDF